jgi:adenylate kinase family enzyme
MAIKVFILGRPGSGKSTIAQLLKTTAEGSGWSTCHIYDYKHLHDMFQQEINDNIPEEERSFRQKGPDACQGFDVRAGKFKVLDTALKQMANKIWIEEQNHSDESMLLLIEFARKEYVHALDIFGYEILNGAYLLYVKLGLDDCIERVQKRANIHRLRSEYDHYVSEDIMTGYYSRDDWCDDQFSKYLNHLRSIDVTDEELDNSGNVQELESKVGKIFNKLISLQPKAAEELLITSY